MAKIRVFILFLIIFICITSVSAVTRNSYTHYGKHLMPNEFDPYFIDDFEHCTPHWYVDWTGTYKYIVEGKEPNGTCKYKTQYNQWLSRNENEWKDYKICYFNEAKLKELSNALREHSGKISSYRMGYMYQTTGTKVEYLLYSYEYYGACKLVWTGKRRNKLDNYP
jgi:hypothetical protein